MNEKVAYVFRMEGIKYMSEYHFYDEFKLSSEKSLKVMNASMSQLEKLSLSNGFQLIQKNLFKNASQIVSLFSDYSKNTKKKNFLSNLFPKEKNLPAYMKNWISLYTLEKNTILYFAENHEDEKLIKEIEKIYPNEPRIYLIDTKNGELVSEIFGKKYSLSKEEIKSVWKKDIENYEKKIEPKRENKY